MNSVVNIVSDSQKVYSNSLDDQQNRVWYKILLYSRFVLIVVCLAYAIVAFIPFTPIFILSDLGEKMMAFVFVPTAILAVVLMEVSSRVRDKFHVNADKERSEFVCSRLRSKSDRDALVIALEGLHDRLNQINQVIQPLHEQHEHISKEISDLEKILDIAS